MSFYQLTRKDLIAIRETALGDLKTAPASEAAMDGVVRSICEQLLARVYAKMGSEGVRFTPLEPTKMRIEAGPMEYQVIADPDGVLRFTNVGEELSCIELPNDHKNGWGFLVTPVDPFE